MNFTIPNPIIDKEKNSLPSIEIPDLHSKRPIISFQFINGMTNGCLESLYKENRTNTKSKLKELQEFINGFSKCNDITDACKMYSGKSLNIKASNGFVDKIIKQLHKNYPKLTGIVSDELAHIHAKRNGKGETVYFGFYYENIFNIVYIDSKHKFDK